MADPNSEQRAVWNGESGLHWVAQADRRDRVLAPVLDELLSQLALQPTDRVLDIGCGCGVTTLSIGAKVAAGAAVGVDISAPMLDVARKRASNATNVSFVEADAQTYHVDTSFDFVISRFGTMFFDDPVAALANIRSLTRIGGRLKIATWQSLLANEWLLAPGAILLKYTDLPALHDDGPGMFAQSDPATVSTMLSAAGWRDSKVESRKISLRLGSDPDDAVDYLADTGLARRVLKTIAPERRAAALAEVAELLGEYMSDGVRLNAGINIVSAVV